MEEYEVYLKQQPLYSSAYFATKAMKDLYLQAPVWVKAWMEALDTMYDDSSLNAAA